MNKFNFLKNLSIYRYIDDENISLSIKILTQKRKKKKSIKHL